MQNLLLPPLLFSIATQEALVKVEVEVHNAVGADPIRTEYACLLMQFFRQASQVQGNEPANVVTKPPCSRSRCKYRFCRTEINPSKSAVDLSKIAVA